MKNISNDFNDDSIQSSFNLNRARELGDLFLKVSYVKW